MAAMDDGIAHYHDDAEVGFEEGMLWLPSHVLDEVYTRNRIHKIQNQHQWHHHQQQNHKSCEKQSQYSSKSITRSSLSHQRPNNKVAANGGPGMQAIFLGSNQRSCGTGVFLPQRTGTNNFQPTKKPACSPVLLPARVVHALNLNVQALGVHISSSPQVHKSNTKCEEVDNNYSNTGSTKKKSDQKEGSKQCSSVLSQNQSSSAAEIFLPKEWTY
ncbi:hypothetical protein PIB30_083811 [Stylosanthes scabra]|uniref:Uncharacterized protein n=1 Tax=Stylosanthes scabra TaxID=79078 RepID=A0ABU6XS90_9FABA|nr:hypothetical protein [Stylosanthes scabra]